MGPVDIFYYCTIFHCATADIWLSTVYCKYLLLLHYHPLCIWLLQWLALDYPLFIVTIWREGGDACERYEQKAARRHRRGLYVSPHHPSVICANCIFQHYMRLFNIRMAVFTPSLHIQWNVIVYTIWYTHAYHMYGLSIHPIYDIYVSIWYIQGE